MYGDSNRVAEKVLSFGEYLDGQEETVENRREYLVHVGSSVKMLKAMIEGLGNVKYDLHRMDEETDFVSGVYWRFFDGIIDDAEDVLEHNEKMLKEEMERV